MRKQVLSGPARGSKKHEDLRDQQILERLPVSQFWQS